MAFGHSLGLFSKPFSRRSLASFRPSERVPSMWEANRSIIADGLIIILEG